MAENYKLLYTGPEINKLLGKANTALQKHQDISHLTSMSDVDKEILKRTVLPHLEKKGDYLYSLKYDFLDYDYALEYFYAEHPEVRPAACSAIRSGNYFGRNFDWYYDNLVSFFVRTPHSNNRLAVIGIAGNLSSLTRDAVENNRYSDDYLILPFYLLDGINEAGVFCNMNVVPLDKGTTIITEPEEEEYDRICARMLPRFVLDKFESAQAAVEYLRDHVAIYPSKSTHEMGYETHFMIGDGENTYVLEIIENKVVIIEHDKMTNFHISGVTFNQDNKVYTPADVEDGHFPSDNGITPNGSGLERYNLLVEGFSEAGTRAGMRTLMNSLFYTKSYTTSPAPADPIWHTEFVGINDLTVDSPAADFAGVEEAAGHLYENRERDIPATEPRTWQTVHSSVYDIANKRLHVLSQENTDVEYTFNLKEYYTAEEIDSLIESLQLQQ